MQAWFKNLRWRAINTVCFLYKYLSPSQRVRFSLFFRFQSYFYSHGFKHFPSNCPSLLLLYLTNIKWPYTRYHTDDKKLSNLWGVIVTTCLMSSKDTFTCPPILHVSTGLIRNFCIANNTLCLRSALFFVTIFSQFLRGVTVVAHKLKSKLMQNFGCIMCIFLIINRTAKEHEWSDPRKWEKNQWQARTFDSRSERGSKPRKRYVLNFLIKRTRSHLVSTLQKLCHIPAFAICKTILYQAAFSLCRSADLSLFSAWYIPNCWFFFSHAPYTFLSLLF